MDGEIAFTPQENKMRSALVKLSVKHEIFSTAGFTPRRFARQYFSRSARAASQHFW